VDLPEYKSDSWRARYRIFRVLSANLMAYNSGIFFSTQVTLQMQAAAGHPIIFGDFPEMTATRSPLASASSSEIEKLPGFQI
jgi:hypothetical protein